MRKRATGFEYGIIEEIMKDVFNNDNNPDGLNTLEDHVNNFRILTKNESYRINKEYPKFLWLHEEEILGNIVLTFEKQQREI